MIRQQIYKGELNLELLDIINDVFERKGLNKILLTEYDPYEQHTRIKGHIFINDKININYKKDNAELNVSHSNDKFEKIILSKLSFKEFLEEFVADYIIASRKIDSLKDKITPNFIESFKRENKINEFLLYK